MNNIRRVGLTLHDQERDHQSNKPIFLGLTEVRVDKVPVGLKVRVFRCNNSSNSVLHLVRVNWVLILRVIDVVLVDIKLVIVLLRGQIDVFTSYQQNMNQDITLIQQQKFSPRIHDHTGGFIDLRYQQNIMLNHDINRI